MTIDAILSDVFSGLDRLAPGSESSTLRALAAVRRVLEPARVLDVGCGTGSQTMVLARNTAAAITAVDLGEDFLATLCQRASAAGVSGRVETLVRSMSELDFDSGTFDTIWSEGSAYVMGFDAALESWGRFLTSPGVLAVSEVSWLKDSPSKRAADFWAAAYPAIRSVPANVAAAASAGYECIDRFTLPAADWTEEYYAPIRERLPALRQKYAGNDEAAPVLDELDAEIAMYDEAGDEYGYVFYVLARDSSGTAMTS